MLARDDHTRSNGSLMRLALLFVYACASARPVALELVQTAPIETTLGLDIADAYATWVPMIDGARSSIDVAQFYVSNAPNSRLEPVIKALEAAIARGVRVRVLAE